MNKIGFSKTCGKLHKQGSCVSVTCAEATDQFVILV